MNGGCPQGHDIAPGACQQRRQRSRADWRDGRHRVHLDEAAGENHLFWAGVSRLSFQYSESWFELAVEREPFTTAPAMTSESLYVQELWI